MSYEHALRDPETLTELWERIWDELHQAVVRGKHRWHTGVFATVEDGLPRPRTVVLRHADREDFTLGLHTDRRAPKVAAIALEPRIGWLFYDTNRRVQVRVDGTARVLVDGPEFERAWADTGLSSRRCYLAPHPPGDDLPTGVNLPEDFRDADPTFAQSEAGRDNFAVVRTRVDRLEWLSLCHSGHRRAVFEPDGRGWRGRFIAA
ncbi:MAG: pyridoxamine 5'-phosphate oxidase family protein [Planctomycetota bacterium]